MKQLLSPLLYRRFAIWVLAGGLAVASAPLQAVKIPALGLGAATVAWADDSEEDWPDQIDYPPQRPYNTPQNTAPRAPANAGLGAPSPSGGGIKLRWPFGKKAKADRKPPPTEEQIVNVGPKEPPPSPNPLLRLSTAFRTETGIISGGFYLVAVRETSPDTRELTLLRQNKPLYTLPVHRSAQAVEPSPVAPVTPPARPVNRLETELRGDQQAVRFVLTSGETRFESDWLPTAFDTRRQLTY